MARIGAIFRPQLLRSALTAATSSVAPSSSIIPRSSTLTPAISSSLLSRSIPTRRAASSTSGDNVEAGTKTKVPVVPEPTPFVPDVETFLTVIGRGLRQHSSKIPSWEALFTLSSAQLQELGFEPPRTRRYLLQWRQRFRRGDFGIGGDLRHIGEGGVADLRVLDIPAPAKANGDVANETRRIKYIVNVPPGTEDVATVPADQLSRVRGYKVRGAKTIAGPFALPLKGNEGARITITEGMWEDRRGHKVDGGERRRTEVRYKKRIAERRALREKGVRK